MGDIEGKWWGGWMMERGVDGSQSEWQGGWMAPICCTTFSIFPTHTDIVLLESSNVRM